MNIKLLKCHGSGNDFVLIDEISNDYRIDEELRVKLVTELSDRGKMFGSDGLLYVQRSDRPGADGRMRFFNTDGSEAEMCGNGVRCVGRYVAELTKKDEVVIETMRRNIPIGRVDDLFPDVPTFDVTIGEPNLDPASLPMIADGSRHVDAPIPELHPTLRFTALSIPNPHIVAVVDAFEPELVELAERANTEKTAFPRGVNVSFMKILGPDAIFVLTYERGVGITNSCGTAMSASSFVACLLGHTAPGVPIRVYNKGGMVRCLVDGDAAAVARADAPVHLIGNATYVFEAMLDVPSADPATWSSGERTYFDEENRQYDRLVESVGREIDVASFYRL
ncbi:diaminopimelate epimerase [Paenibacillus sp.]|uniref:diaminopimelate epimerase n=1 Tax=Paenibacillus sp. TaxID=58172 RepID=UPI002D713C02|nr:diaminopimelate epimerase [Paenibacillus sp.]HZG56005.1 diaminopimelate epimerase [Paenibacillus sp.]